MDLHEIISGIRERSYTRQSVSELFENRLDDLRLENQQLKEYQQILSDRCKLLNKEVASKEKEAWLLLSELKHTKLKLARRERLIDKALGRINVGQARSCVGLLI